MASTYNRKLHRKPVMQSRIELKANQRILFIGDSITDADRRDPAYQPLGNGYVHFVSNMLVAKYPQLNLEIINRGINGDTTRGMKQRWSSDCIEHKPDVLSVLIGINDLWTQHAGAEYLPYAVEVDEYELTYRLLLSEAKEKCDCKFVLVERHGSSLPLGARLDRATMVGRSRIVRNSSPVEKFFIAVDSVRTRTKKHLRKIDSKNLRIWSLHVIVFLLICR